MLQRTEISLDERYRKLLQDTKQIEDELKEERRLRGQVELRIRELEASYPEAGLRVDRLEAENKKLRLKLRKQDK